MKNRKKRFLALRLLCLLLALAAAFSLAGCAVLSDIYGEPSGYSGYELSDGRAAPDGESTPQEDISGAEDGSGEEDAPVEASREEAPTIAEDGEYTSKEDVALYIHTYGHLPENFITKREARELGWSGGSLEPYAEGCSIGGDRFGNREGRLPDAEGRIYTECDIDTRGAEARGAKRIVFSNDGLVYYTGDHYETFELLYGEE